MRSPRTTALAVRDPPELHDLGDTAVSIARSHPDEYIRHRVEVEVQD